MPWSIYTLDLLYSVYKIKMNGYILIPILDVIYGEGLYPISNGKFLRK